jgi:hypothetical protein
MSDDSKNWARWRNRKLVLPGLLLAHNRKCHWCQIPVVETAQRRPDQATVDHLKTKRQGRKHYMEGGHVLSCYRCNHKRNNVEMKAIGVAIQKEKAVRQKLQESFWKAYPADLLERRNQLTQFFPMLHLWHGK